MTHRNILIVALLISVAVNLFFIGGIGFRMSNVRDQREARPFPPNVGWIVRDLDEQRRDELTDPLRQSYEEIRPLRSEMFLAQRRVNELMSSADFDADELASAFAELRAANDRYQAMSHQQTINILGELSEEERRIALEFVQRRGPRDGRDGFRGREGGPRFGGDRDGDGERRGDRFPPGAPPPPDAGAPDQ